MGSRESAGWRMNRVPRAHSADGRSTPCWTACLWSACWSFEFRWDGLLGRSDRIPRTSERIVKLQLIGLPLSAHRRIKMEAGDWRTSLGPDHVILPVPSQHERRPVIADPQLREIRSGAGNGFVHLLVVPTRDWKVVQEQFQF